MDSNNIVSECFNEIYEEALSKGCCEPCAMRISNINLFENANFTKINKKNLRIKWESGKRKRSYPCVVCLGILDDSFIELMRRHPGLEEIKKIQSPTFTFSITYSNSIFIRERSMLLHLKDTFGTNFDEKRLPTITKVLREMMFAQDLEKILEKSFTWTSNLVVEIQTAYELETDELFPARPLRVQKCKKKTTSKHGIKYNLKTCSENHFRKIVTVPPQHTLESVQLVDITCDVKTTYLCGRYNKFVRNLHQSKTEFEDNSVEEIVVDGFKKVLGDRNVLYLFKPIGWDSPEIRVLGNGRFFNMEIVGSPTIFTEDVLNDIIRSINESSCIRITDLRMIKRKDLGALTAAECKKGVEYKILCMFPLDHTKKPIIETINKIGCFQIRQKTPIRLGHIREFIDKYKKIHSLKAFKVEGYNNLLELHILVDSGVWVPEFIHGDFGRTYPSLLSLTDIDFMLVAMDITNIIKVEK